MGFYERKEEVLVGTDPDNNATTRLLNCAVPRIRSSAIYIYVVLGRSFIYIEKGRRFRRPQDTGVCAVI